MTLKAEHIGKYRDGNGHDTNGRWSTSKSYPIWIKFWQNHFFIHWHQVGGWEQDFSTFRFF
jgi:hypothetical protein